MKFAPSLAVVDVSFISLEKVLPPLARCLGEGSEIIALVKPQFELKRGDVGKGGIVREPLLHRRAVERIVDDVAAVSNALGLEPAGTTPSPITGAEGNQEVFLHLVSGA